MKKVKKSTPPPRILSDYLLANPNDEWVNFKNNDRNGGAEVKSTLILDQRKICAYCENELATYHGIGLDDFRVEHFHPKRPHNPHPNYSLDWNNLLGVCTGGNARDIGNPDLFTSPDCSCDVPKGDKNLTNLILNPLSDIPAFPAIFEFNEQGDMNVGSGCPAQLRAKAQKSIDELNLSPTTAPNKPKGRLIRFRKIVIDQIAAEIAACIDSGESASSASTTVAEALFPANCAEPWPKFFSCIRWYLGSAAESRLRNINYDG